MRILVLNYEFPPVGGGGGRVAESLCRELVKRGHEIHVQTAHLKGLPKIETRDGYTIYRSFSFRRRADTCTIPEMGAYILTNILPTWRQINSWKPDVIHVHFAVPSGCIAWIMKCLTGTPYLLTAHLGDIPGGNPDQTGSMFKLIKPMTNPIWDRASAVTTVSESNKQLALKSYDVPVEVIPNGIKLKRIDPQMLHIHQPIKLVFAGRFNPQKNLLFLVDILKACADHDWEMDLIGDGPLFFQVKEKVSCLGLIERVKMHGWVPADVAENLTSQGDILLLPSTSEGMSVVGVQALGYGLAILGSDIGGINDVVRNGLNGFLCPVNDLKSFSSGLRLMLSSKNKLLEMRKASLSMAADFDLDGIVKRYEQILMKVAK